MAFGQIHAGMGYFFYQMVNLFLAIQNAEIPPASVALPKK
jgi:hypothetical protein